MNNTKHCFLIWMYIYGALLRRAFCWRRIHWYGPRICQVLCHRHTNCSSPLLNEVEVTCDPPVNTPTANPGCYTKRKVGCFGFQTNQDLPTEYIFIESERPGDEIAGQTMPACSPTEVKTLLKACEERNLEEVKRFVCEGLVDVNCRGKEGQTAAMLAAWEADEDVFDLLVQQNADPSAVDEDDYNALHYACRGGSAYIVKRLLDDYNLAIEQTDRFDSTPLFHAVYTGNIAVVRLLMERGAKVKADEDVNILHEACMGGKVNMVRYVLSLNLFEIDCKEVNGQTPLMAAVTYCHRPVVDLLRDNGADITVVDYDNNTMLHKACVCGDEDMVKYLITLNIFNLESRGQGGKTSLMVAVIEGQIPVVKLLIDKGADVETVDRDNLNILHQACYTGDEDMVKYILSLNIFNIECRSFHGQTPLMYAVCIGNVQVVKLLQKRGAITAVVNNDDRNVLHIACERGPLEMVQYLMTLEELGGFEEKIDNLGLTPIDIAKKNDNYDIVTFLNNKRIHSNG